MFAHRQEIGERLGRVRGIRQQVDDGYVDNRDHAFEDVMIEDACLANLETNVHDPELREKLRPTYRAACKDRKSVV